MKLLFNPNFPISPKKSKVFYGWVILLASIIGIVASIPGQTMGVSVFTDSLISATGLSRLWLANAYLVGTLMSALLLPFGGSLIDILGSRKTIVISCACLGISLALLSITDYISRFIIGISSYFDVIQIYISFFVLVLGFASIRFFGQGMVTMTSRTMLAKWFHRKRGMVSGIQGVFVAFTFSVAPYFLNKLIDSSSAVGQGEISSHGWRYAWLFLAVIIGVVVNGICWLLFRDNPETCGLQMDGHVDKTKSKEDVLKDSEQAKKENLKGATRGEAIKTLAFWAPTMALVSQACIITAITFHIINLGAEFNLDKDEAVWVFFPIAIVSTVIGYSIGFLADYTKLKYLFMFMMLGLIIGLLAFINFDKQGYRILTIIGLGISGGCFGPLSTVVLPRFFGRAHLGAIAGVQSMSMVAGSALGPSLFALLQKMTSSYVMALQVSLILPVITIVLLIFVRAKRYTPLR